MNIPPQNNYLSNKINDIKNSLGKSLKGCKVKKLERIIIATVFAFEEKTILNTREHTICNIKINKLINRLLGQLNLIKVIGRHSNLPKDILGIIKPYLDPIGIVLRGVMPKYIAPLQSIIELMVYYDIEFTENNKPIFAKYLNSRVFRDNIYEIGSVLINCDVKYINIYSPKITICNDYPSYKLCPIYLSFDGCGLCGISAPLIQCGDLSYCINCLCKKCGRLLWKKGIQRYCTCMF